MRNNGERIRDFNLCYWLALIGLTYLVPEAVLQIRVLAASLIAVPGAMDWGRNTLSQTIIKEDK